MSGAQPEAIADAPEKGALKHLRPKRLKKRRDFLAAAKALKWATPGFVLQGRLRAADGSAEDAAGVDPRLGFTASKKVGNAVARARAKRRLRAVSDRVMPGRAKDHWDYVLIARAELTASLPMDAMAADLALALERLHSGKARKADDRRSKAKAGKSKKDGA